MEENEIKMENVPRMLEDLTKNTNYNASLEFTTFGTGYITVWSERYPDLKIVPGSVCNMIFPQPYDEMLTTVELAARTCYQSEPKSDPESFIKSIIKRGHESVLEHSKVTMDIITDRGISHELVRHRIASYSQESTRYVNYNKKGYEFVIPNGMTSVPMHLYDIFIDAIASSMDTYKKLISEGVTPQITRAVLPTCLKTEIVVTMNLREWRHFLDLRCSPAAHPDMQILAKKCGRELYDNYPVFFEDKLELFDEKDA